ncbi:LON peptidase substrate-binding domain-containing protein, partial [Streptomyces sp. NPDC058953]|uniref:LON peptidase substrate-binding domain-containing protein n=1 Tax=Streptomyces sp. NPDC058953 TaxID=3346676 RepID=UPI00369FDAE1
MTTARLPLFPLNSVLFPGLVLPLNVFEERYRAMMRELLKTDESQPRRFAVVAIRDGHEVAPSTPGLQTHTGSPDSAP